MSYWSNFRSYQVLLQCQPHEKHLLRVFSTRLTTFVFIVMAISASTSFLTRSHGRTPGKPVYRGETGSPKNTTTKILKKSVRSNFYFTNILVEFWYALPSYSCLVSSYSCLVPLTPVKFHLISKQYSGKNRSDQDKALLQDA